MDIITPRACVHARRTGATQLSFVIQCCVFRHGLEITALSSPPPLSRSYPNFFSSRGYHYAIITLINWRTRTDFGSAAPRSTATIDHGVARSGRGFTIVETKTIPRVITIMNRPAATRPASPSHVAPLVRGRTVSRYHFRPGPAEK